jgi:copper chaperone CopZ
MKTILRIEGMSCEHCVKCATTALKSVNGVKSAKVSLNDKTAVVEHSGGVTLDALKDAVASAGYEVIG